MPALVQRNARSGNATGMTSLVAPAAGNGIWSNKRGEFSLEQLDKFWNELPHHARQKLLRIEKQTLFEQARKNMYCSRCNGLLLEGFSQIVLYGKSLQQEGGGGHLRHKRGTLINGFETELDDVQDPSVHPWGGLVATRDGTLTLMDCYLYAKSLSPLQNVFDSARAREHERELLYPDACGGGGRGWISHGMTNYGRVHGTRETCALHTARLSCDTLVDFWLALGDETRLSLLRMKEEDFIERLVYRFDSKRFCRDCRRNVIREFKELKELKRMRRETRCTSWFCVADTAFQYEVSDDTVQADWHQSFMDTVGTYHHFEWAIGTGEGKSDILDFEDVGMTGEAQVNGLDLCDLDACFITLRAWRLDGRCTELTVKAHALKGQPCVHRRLVVGDGFVTITKGDNIRSFFEHAEEAEEEEDDDAMDKDGNELDTDGSRPQKHAKSPELAREFLLDAATVIFKEQVEKAFREGTARQNAHSTFVCLALKLLEERVHIACKEIITLEKQIKLLEEEEKEKREEEERKERRRTKEREKKLRRKERLKEKERDKERKYNQCDMFLTVTETSPSESPMYTHEEPPSNLDSVDSYGEEGHILVGPHSPDIVDKNSSSSVSSKSQDLESDSFHIDGEPQCSEEDNGSFILGQSKSARRKLRFKQDSVFSQASKQPGKARPNFDTDSHVHHDGSEMKANVYNLSSSRCHNGVNKQSRGNMQRIPPRNCDLKNVDKFPTSKSRIRDGYEYNSCSCNHHADLVAKDARHLSLVRPGWEFRTLNKAQSTLDSSRQLYNSSKYNHGYHTTDSPAISKGKPGTVNSHLSRAVLHMKKVWEPTDSRKKCLKNGSDGDITPRTSLQVDSSEGVGCNSTKNRHEQPHRTPQASDGHCSSGVSRDSREHITSSHDDCVENSNISNTIADGDCSNDFGNGITPLYYAKKVGEDEADSCSVSITFPTNITCGTLLTSSSSDNCSSCLSEADSSSSSSSAQNAESSSTSDSEDASQLSEVREIQRCDGDTLHSCQDCGTNDKNKIDVVVSFSNGMATGVPVARCTAVDFVNSKPTQNVHISDASRYGYETVSRQQQMLPMHNNSFRVPYYSAPAMTYQSQAQPSWTAVPTNGIVSFAQPHQYIFPSPLGYGLPANRPSEFCMQYNGMQPLTTAVLNVNQPSTYQTVKKVNIVKLDEQTKNSKMSGYSQTNGICDSTRINNPVERSSIPIRQPSPKSQSVEECDNVESAGQSLKTSFSLFHSGGPVASGHSLDPASLKNKTIPEAPTKNTIKEETTVEEYSLFASSGGRFSFF